MYLPRKEGIRKKPRVGFKPTTFWMWGVLLCHKCCPPKTSRRAIIRFGLVEGNLKKTFKSDLFNHFCTKASLEAKKLFPSCFCSPIFSSNLDFRSKFPYFLFLWGQSDEWKSLEGKIGLTHNLVHSCSLTLTPSLWHTLSHSLLIDS